MAIYPVTNAYVVNKDAVVGSPFKSGMILMTNSEGKVVPADSQLLAIKNISQKQAAIIGVAAGDYNISGNTIIVPDYIGSNYLDANSNFVSASDREYLSIRRQLLDYADETVNEYYNINYSPKPSRTGIGVYSLLGESFITDQFSPVLHGDYGIDGTVIQSLNPGDLLTFGGGINAGKLVKVNANSFGPDVLVVGIVDRYVTNTGLLHFRQVSYSLSFGTNPYVLAIDAGNAVSYANGSSTTTNLVNGTSGGTLINGTSYSSANSGAWAFDGTNDYINNTFTGTFTNSATVLIWLQPDHPVQSLSTPPLLYYTGLMTFTNSILVSHYPWTDESAYISILRTNRVGPIALSPSVDRAIPHLLVITTDGTNWKMYQNNILINTTAAEPTVGLNHTIIGNGGYSNTQYWFKGKIFQFNLLNQALTQTQITNYYNLTKGRYGV
jgi:hypothetical protein